MALGGGMSCVKYLLFCFNLLFVITGLIVFIIGLVAEVKAHPYIDLTDQAFYTSGPILLIVIGVIVFIVAFLGCCGAVRENYCMVLTFSIFLLIIFVAELAVSISAYVVHRPNLNEAVEKYLNQSIGEYNNNTDVQKTFDMIQTDLSCCGIKTPDDWKTHGLAYPESCCSGKVVGADKTACEPADPTFHHDGCLPKVVDFLNSISLWLGGIGIGIAVVQLLGVLFACCLARSIRSQYETV